MQTYELTKDAEQDLRELARYTLSQWGKKILRQYQKGLKDTFYAIATNEVPQRTFSEVFADLYVTKYRYHYIFYFTDIQTRLVIIGVIHERRDIVSRLSSRLS